MSILAIAGITGSSQYTLAPTISVLFLIAFVGCEPVDSTSPQTADSAPTAIAPVLETSDAWPLFRGDQAADGLARCELPAVPELLWTFSIEDGGFEATAAIAKGLVYVGSTDGSLYAVRLEDGQKAWAFSTEQGFATAPAVYDGRVYIGDDDGRFRCLDAETGKPVWHFDADAGINSAANFHQGNVLFGSQDSILYCLDARTGKLVWKYKSDDQIRCSPSVIGNRAFVAGCDGRLHVVDLKTGRETISVPLGSPTGCTPALSPATETADGKPVSSMAYVGTEGGTFFAIDWRAGKVFWRYENPKRTLPYRSSAAVTSEAVLVGSRDKSLHAIARKTGKPLWTFPTRGRVDSSPVVVGERVFVGSSDGRLYALGLQSGKLSWKYAAGGSITASPAVAAGRLVIGSDDGDLFCFGSKPP